MRPGARKLLATLHIVSSVGWFGAVAVFLVLAIAGWLSSEISTIRGVYFAMGLAYAVVIIPLGLVSFATGLIVSLGTRWGLVQHYWVLTKLLLTAPASALMLLHAATVSYAAATTSWAPGLLAGLRLQLAIDGSLALLVLLLATVLSTYKPRGRTGWGQRGPSGPRRARPA